MVVVGGGSSHSIREIQTDRLIPPRRPDPVLTRKNLSPGRVFLSCGPQITNERRQEYNDVLGPCQRIKNLVEQNGDIDRLEKESKSYRPQHC